MGSTEESRDLLRKKIKEYRVVMAGLTVVELCERTRPNPDAKMMVSPSHLGRIERRERFPTATILLAVTQALGLSDDSEEELFVLAGYRSPRTEKGSETRGQLDPYVAEVLSQEPLEVQRVIPLILLALRGIAKSHR